MWLGECCNDQDMIGYKREARHQDYKAKISWLIPGDNMRSNVLRHLQPLGNVWFWHTKAGLFLILVKRQILTGDRVGIVSAQKDEKYICRKLWTPQTRGQTACQTKEKHATRKRSPPIMIDKRTLQSQVEREHTVIRGLAMADHVAILVDADHRQRIFVVLRSYPLCQDSCKGSTH